MREQLDGEKRQALFADMLSVSCEHGCEVVVAINDLACQKANRTASSHEIDATLLVLERFNTWLGTEFGVVVVSKPAGGIRDENKFVSECIEHVIAGTPYVNFAQLALKPLIMPAKNARLLQVADLAVSITNAHVSGGNDYADMHFPKVMEMMPETSRGVRGGMGLKLHPSLRYRNLYHWLLGDEYFVTGNKGLVLPETDKPYPANPNEWR